MKNKLLVLLTAIILTAVAMTAAGCDAIDNIKDIKDNIDNIDNSDDGDTHSDDMRTEDEIKSNLGDNYEITMKYGYYSTDNDSSAAYITTKKVGDAVFTETTNAYGQKNTFFTVGNRIYTNYDSESGKFEKCICMSDTATYTDAYSQIMTNYTDSVSYDTKSNGKYLDRDVTIYKWQDSASILVASVSYEWEHIVDNQTGLLLKRTYKASGSSIEGSGSAASSFEVTNIKLGGVSLDAEMAKIGVEQWLTENDIRAFGLTSIPQIDGTFFYSSADINDEGTVRSLEYVYMGTDESAFNALCRSFYDAGYAKDRDCTAKAFDELSVTDEYTGMKSSFNGYVGTEENGYERYVEIQLIPVSPEEGCMLKVVLYNNN